MVAAVRGEAYEHSRWADDGWFDDGRPIRLRQCCRCNGPRPLNELNICGRCAPGSTMVNHDPRIDTVYDREAEAERERDTNPERWDR